ncbi:MAG: D-2-hydroxyacid dehydrogenase, partial [Caldilineaceae bacterium]|nr:D-2-hydroxyacid dehydrogenase [Caldilineaceae bacterium]
MHRTIVLVGEAIGPENLARLTAAHPDCEFRYCLDPAAYLANVAEAEIIFSKQFPPGTLDRGQRLRWIQAGTAGVNHLIAAGIADRDIVLTNARGAHGTPIAEQTLALMFAFANRLPTLIRAQAERKHVAKRVIAEKFEVAGQTLLVIGLGDIGGTLAQKAKLLGMRVLGMRRTTEPFPGLDAQYTPDQLLAALPQADHVALCLPLTDATNAIVGEAELRAMKPSAHIYNVGRGASIEPDALLRALQEGWIAGAGLDCTDPEPLPIDSPLWDLDNVLLAQHTSGSSPYNADRITQIFLDNLGRYRRGEGLKNVVD